MVFFYIHAGNALYMLEVSKAHLLNAVYANNFYGRMSFPEFFLAFPYVIFNSLELRFYYVLISLAFVYWIVYRKKETNYLLMWFLAIFIYLNYGTSSLSKYVPFLAVARYLSYITFPGILMLSAFLIEKEGLIRKVVFPFALVILFVTSIGVVYLDNSRHSLDNLRSVHSYFSGADKPIFTDSRSKMVLEYLSGYKGIGINDIEKYQDDLKGINGAYILINYQMIKNRRAAGDDIKFLGEIETIPYDWKKIKEIGNIQDEKIVVYYAG